MLVAVTVALETLIETMVVADCGMIVAEPEVAADCREDAAASSCSGGGARKVSFVGLSQDSFVPQQAHKPVLEL